MFESRFYYYLRGRNMLWMIVAIQIDASPIKWLQQDCLLTKQERNEKIVKLLYSTCLQNRDWYLSQNPFWLSPHPTKCMDKVSVFD